MLNAALILAAGYSRRLGFFKQTVKIGEQTLLEAIYKKLAATTLDKIIVVLNEGLVGAFKVAQRDQIIVHLDVKNHGIGSSIQVGIQALQGETFGRCLLATCDQVLVTSQDYQHLIQASYENDTKIICAEYHNTFGVPCVFPNIFFEDLKRLSGDVGAKKIIYQNLKRIFPVALAKAEFDIDHLSDLEAMTLNYRIPLA